jgi:hypothetical protein
MICPIFVIPPSYLVLVDKKCGRCGAVKDESEFKWIRTKGRRDYLCKACRQAYQREHYLKNRQRYIDRAAAHTQKALTERTAFILEYLAEHPCADCGETDPVVLEFDHLRDKKFLISHGIRERNWEMVLAEIAKCDVVCVNCHRRRTAIRRGFDKLTMFERGS